jgi:hypothetical protein
VTVQSCSFFAPAVDTHFFFFLRFCAMDVSALEAATLYERLNKDANLWWCIVGADFPPGGVKPVAYLQYEGGTSLDDLVSRLSDDGIQYGCFKVLGVDTKGAITSTRTKFVR